MSKRPKDGDEGRWPTPSEEYGITPLEIPPGDQRGSRDNHEAVRDSAMTDVKVESADKDSFVFDISEYNYIDWTDICVPTNNSESENNNVQEDTRESSRLSLSISTDSVGRRSVSSGTEEKADQEDDNTLFEKQSTCPIPTCRKQTKK